MSTHESGEWDDELPDSDALRGPMSDGLERFANEVRLGRHEDPHVAFAVLVYPDREPAVFAVVKDYAYNLTELRASTDERDGDPFPMAEFDQARLAMDDASLGFLIGQHGGYIGSREVGECIADQIRKRWDRLRLEPLERALMYADYEATHPVECPTCKRRFRTERGLAMHQARTRSMRCKITTSDGPHSTVPDSTDERNERTGDAR